MNRLSPKKQAHVLHLMMRRGSVRGLAETAYGNSKTREEGVSVNTVLKLLADAGDAAIEFLDLKMRHLPSRFVEADEVYCIVKLKRSTLAERGVRIPGLGAVWLWVAIDADTKLIIAWHLGGRAREDARPFMRDLSGRLAGRIQLTTDSLMAYPDAVAEAFDDIDYATIKKRSAEEEELRLQAELTGKPYRPRFRRRKDDNGMVEKDLPVHHLGTPDDARATTNHIEAFFTQLRKDLARMTRRATTISKSLQNLERTFALYVFHHNFVKRHTSLNKLTPAQAAGIDDSKWEWCDFIVFLDDIWERRRTAKRSPAEVEAKDDRPLVNVRAEGPFCVCHSKWNKTAKVHLSRCAHLRTQPGREGKKGLGAKLYCDSVEEARSLAEELAPGRVTDCKVCLGTYNVKDYLGPRNTSRSA
jgi:IS1 family transposase